jgi:hypothetical protein
VTGMDATPRTIGLYLPAGDTTTYRAVLDDLAKSVSRGAWYVDLAERLVVTRLPRSVDVTPVRAYRCITDQGEPTAATGGLKPTGTASVVPAKQITLQFAENPSPTDAGSNAATAEMATRWKTQWLTAKSPVDGEVVANYGLAAIVETVTTKLTLRADAEAEAVLFGADYANPPEEYELRVRDAAPGVWIGDSVTVIDDIPGAEDGRAYVVAGRTNTDRGGGATLYLTT